MGLPFTRDQFFEVFRRYNEAVWPAQWVLYAFACAAIMLAIRGKPRDGRLISGVLATFWLWMAIGYHFTFFAAVNRAAIVFGALFGVQAVLFGAYGVWKGQLEFRPQADLAGITGMLLVAYALVGYPLLGAALGHRYPASPTFGVPCPTTIFTLALLLWARPPLPRALLAVPLLWAALGTSAALVLGVREDWGLALAGVLAAALLLGTLDERRRGARKDASVAVAPAPN